MLSRTVKDEFDSVKGLVCHVLERYPITRSSDTELYLQCCRELGASTLDQASRVDLNVISVHKIRQVIQNKEGKFLPPVATISKRSKRSLEVTDYMINN